jgi:TonB family protein
MRIFGSAISRVLPGFFLLAALCGLAQVQERSPKTEQGRIAAKIAAAAVEHEHSPLPRILLFDVAFPANAEEANALKGNALLQVSMITRDEKERPIKRVYIVKDGREHTLSNACSICSFWRQAARDTAEFNAFGEFRQDALFLLPIDLSSPGSILEVDLANDEKRLQLGNLPLLPSNLVRAAGGEDRKASLDIKFSELKSLITREFPGLPSAPLRVRVSQGVAAANLIKKTNPVYPEDAKQNRLQGAVVMRITIGKDGLIKNVQLISGHPALSPAAMEAVKQWAYKPYLLSGEPVEVETQIIINFTLGG